MLERLFSKISDPYVDDPLKLEAATAYRDDRAAFDARAREAVLEHAPEPVTSCETLARRCASVRVHDA